MTILSGEPNRTTFGTFHLNSGTLKTMLIPSLVIGAKEERPLARGLFDARSRKGQVNRLPVENHFCTLLHEVMTEKMQVDDYAASINQ